MAQKKHLRELLREEQEPFLLKDFIQERRGLLRRRPPSPKKTTTTALVPSTSPAKTPLFLPSNPKTPSLFSLAAKKTSASSSALNPTAYFILDAALRIQEKQNKSHSRRSIRGLDIAFFGSVLKRLVSFRKPRREIQARDVTLSIKDILVWDSPHAGDCRKRIQVTNCLEKRRSASHGDGNHGMEKNEVEDKSFCFSSSEDGRGTSSCSDENRSPEFESPAASPTRRKPEGQLVSGTRPEEEYDEEQRQEKEQQLSPVSVLDLDPDPTLEEEEEDHLERHVDSYERSLAIVQRAKQQLMHHLRRFQRLTSLDPMELDQQLLAEEEHDDVDYDQNISHSQMAEEEACSCSPSCILKRGMMDMKKLTMDLIDEEKSMAGTTEKLGQEEEQLLLEKVRHRFEAWKEVESNTIDMMVSLDLRRETQRWDGRCKEQQMQEIAALVEIAIFEMLIIELSGELTNYDHQYHHHQQQQQQVLLLVS